MIKDQRFSQRDPQTFLLFLQHCKEVAKARKHAQLVSISLRVKHIDPLAVLESIYEPDQLHFYLENAQQDIGIAGAEKVVGLECSGEDRFQQVKAFSQEVLDNCIAIGDLELPLAGPHFFCASAFSSVDTSEETGFAPVTVFVPCWQVARKAQDYVAVANMLIDADAPIEALAQRVLAAHGRFSSFSYSEQIDERPAISFTEAREVGPDGGYQDAVKTALERIGENRYEKIVLARAIDVTANEPFAPLDILSRLRERYASCYCYSIANGQGKSFIGATPERLVRVDNGVLTTEALAGSCARGSSVRGDAMLSRELLASDKNLREHRSVSESIQNRLNKLGIDIEIPETPGLLKLANVQHLKSPLIARLPEQVHIMDLMEALHPRQAVGGRPRARACPDISELEAFERGLYAGALGWFDAEGDGDMVVGLRSGLFEDKQARLYAGAGIVSGSDPDDEYRETELKIAALQEAIAVAEEKG